MDICVAALRNFIDPLVNEKLHFILFVKPLRVLNKFQEIRLYSSMLMLVVI